MKLLDVPHNRLQRNPFVGGKNFVIGRPVTTGALFGTFTDLTGTTPKGQVLLVREIIGNGSLREADSNDAVILRMTDGSTNTDMPFLAPTLIAAAGKFNLDWKLDGMMIVPPGFKLQGESSSASNTVQLVVIGEYISLTMAEQLGLYNGTGGQFAVGVYDVTTAGTRQVLKAGVAGKCMQIDAFNVRGFANDASTPNNVLLEWGDGTNFYPIAGWYHVGTTPSLLTNEQSSDVGICGPAGFSLYVNSSVDLGFSVNVVGRFKNPNQADTYDLTGRHNFFGTASAGDATTVTDSAKSGSKAWVADEWVGATVRVIAGTNVGESSVVTTNTDNDLTVSPAFGAAIDNTSVYVIEPVTPFKGTKFWYYADAIGANIPFPRNLRGFTSAQGFSISGITAAGANLAYWGKGLTAAGILSPAIAGFNDGTPTDATKVIARTMSGLEMPWPVNGLISGDYPGMMVVAFNPFRGTVWGARYPVKRFDNLIKIAGTQYASVVGHYQGA